MKKFFIMWLAIVAIIVTACNNNTAADNENENADTSKATMENNNPVIPSAEIKNVDVQDIVAGYLQVKNGLANDNGNDAAKGGKAIVTAISKLDTASITPEQKTAYNDIQDDLKENAEHIGDNAGKIDHQREHFDMLSQDIYDFVKAFKTDQTLYKDYCPMYNNNKGAFWISETKEIKNPYLGKTMPTCGEIKEEIK